MSEVISFPNKQPIEEETSERSPLEMLKYIAGMIEEGETEADQMIVGWVHRTDNQLQLRYMLAGEPSVNGAIGMLEMVKIDLAT